MAVFRAAGAAMALTEVCSNCGAVIGARAFWSFVSSESRKYLSRCPLCEAPNPWRKATKEEVSAFRDRARKIRRNSSSLGARFLQAFWTLLFVAIVLTTCIWGEAE